MDKIIELRGRYGTHTLKQLTPIEGGEILKDKESKTYKLVLGSEDDIIRTGYTEEEVLFIDPSGGPYMQVGGILKGNKIKAIDYSYDIEAYVITFE